MTCEQFEQQVHEMMLDAVTECSLDEALAHAESCPGCARLVAGARALRDGLRTLAADRSVQAPPRLEALLLAAFRRQQRAEAALMGRRRWVFAAMAAGAIAAVLAVTVTVREWRGVSGQGTGHATQSIARGSEPSTINNLPNSGSALPSHNIRRSSRPSPMRELRSRPQKRPRVKRPARQTANSGEWATDFFPLPYASDIGGSEAGELVRIELPRSALTELGLPPGDDTYGEAAAETISAEVFIGEDGVARAIRFVR